MPKFITSKKQLTVYALACGYLETNKGYDKGNEYRFTLGMEHTAYHVKGFNKDIGRICWEVFDDINDARKYFMKTLKEYNQQREIPRG